MITELPAQCIVKALDMECQMLRNDVENNRLPLPADAFSIFYFTEFVHAAKLGRILTSCRPLPPEHIEFFKEIVSRLVQAGELPQVAINQFDRVFMNEVC